MKFSKMHGLGNDFILVNGFDENIPEENLQETAIKFCSRHFGIGADGLILVLPSRVANFRMRIFNRDGSEAEMCGNGVRCFAHYVRSHGLTRENTIEIETLAGIIRPQILSDDSEGPQVRVDMGLPHFNRKDIPMRGDGLDAIGDHLRVDRSRYEFTAISMGNPHCVIFVDNLKTFPVEKVGPQIENHSLFPRRTNVEFVQVINANQARMRVWERGAGETLACGTGACAAAVACAVNSKTGRKINMDLNGGSLLIEWTGEDHVLMTGPAVEVYNGEIALPD